jgi:predicted metalloprotease
MRFNPRARIDQSQYQDAGGSGGGSGSGMRGIPLPTGRGGLSVSAVVIAIVVYVVTQYVGGSSGGGGGDTTKCQTGADANTSEKCATALLGTSVQDYWERAYPEQTGRTYQPAALRTYAGGTPTGCGQGSAAMGPFYCPNDRTVYVADDFLSSMLEGDLKARGGDFALGYVVAHEYGHHIENLLGVLGRMRTQQGPTSDSVKAELMADCLGGMWARAAGTTVDENGTTIIEDLTEDDVARAVDAAKSVGDDRLGAGRENWTHGSSAQRMHWFQVGFEKGTIEACNTFGAGVL